ncbi:MAG: hypothetical protein QXX20_02925 [Candidatus Thermoplasmatota archaeon]
MNMNNHKKSYHKKYTKKGKYTKKNNEYINTDDVSVNDIIELCIKKGLIERTDYGYYFKPEFFETLDIYKIYE